MLILQRKKIHNTLDEGDIGVGEIAPVQPSTDYQCAGGLLTCNKIVDC